MSELPSETDPAPQEPVKGPLQQHRGMVILVVVMGIMMVVGFGVLVGTIIYRASGGNSQQDEAPAIVGEVVAESTALEALSIARPAGAELVGATSAGNRLTLHFRNDGGDGDIVMVVDLASGVVISRIEIPARNAEDE